VREEASPQCKDPRVQARRVDGLAARPSVIFGWQSRPASSDARRAEFSQEDKAVKLRKEWNQESGKAKDEGGYVEPIRR